MSGLHAVQSVHSGVDALTASRYYLSPRTLRRVASTLQGTRTTRQKTDRLDAICININTHTRLTTPRLSAIPSSPMAGPFDRFRFDAKRKRDETALDLPDVEANEEDAEPIAVKSSAKWDTKTSSATASKRPCCSPERSAGSKWQERWHAICDDCFDRAQHCEHYPAHRLRLLIVGHNPSDHAWKTGYSYRWPKKRLAQKALLIHVLRCARAST